MEAEGHRRVPGASGDAFRALAETTPDAILTADASGVIVFANAAAEKLLGHAREQLIGALVETLVPEDVREAHRSGFARYVGTREARMVGSTVAVAVLRADGSQVPVELSLGAAGGGDDLTLTAVIRDVSERVRHQRYTAAQLTVTQILTGPETPDQHARIVKALTAALGWQIGALWLLADGDDRLRLAELWQSDPEATELFAEVSQAATFRRSEGAPGRAWDTRQPVWLDQARRDGSFPRAAAAAAAGVANGVFLPLVTEDKVIGVLELLTTTRRGLDDDLRDMLTTVASQIGESLRRQQHAADLGRSNAELEQFASVVAHDLSEPLRTVAGFAQLLEGRAGDSLGTEEAEWVAHIAGSAQRGQRILDRVLDLARIGASRFQASPVDLNLVLGDALIGLRAMIDDTGARIEPAKLPTLSGDETLLGQVFQNLLANAMKFSDEAPHVVITAHRDPEGWRIDIADNGRGIAAGHEVFEMFDRRGSSGEVGIGIGLAVCEKAIERHGGRIWHAPGPAGGTVFSFTIPDR